MPLQDYICRDPAICGGEPVIKGTRVTVRTVLASLAEGASAEEIVAVFPTVSEDAVRAVIAFCLQTEMKCHEIESCSARS